MKIKTKVELSEKDIEVLKTARDLVNYVYLSSGEDSKAELKTCKDVLNKIMDPDAMF